MAWKVRYSTAIPIASLLLASALLSFLSDPDDPLAVTSPVTNPLTVDGLDPALPGVAQKSASVHSADFNASEELRSQQSVQGKPGPVSDDNAALASAHPPDSNPPGPGDPMSADSSLKTAALRQLAGHNMSQVYKVVWQQLEIGDPDQTGFYDFVVATLESLDDPPAGEILAALIRAAPSPAVRMDCLRLLSEASQELSITPFNQAFHDPDPAVRQSASEFFDGLGANALLEAVAEALLDRDQAVRLAAFSTLEDMHRYAPVWELAELVVNDPDPRIRKRALDLVTYGDPDGAIERLELALADPNPQVSERAAALLTEYEQGPS